MENNNTCKVCDNAENNKAFVAQELQLGLKDEFDYFECSSCGCVQIKEPPENIGKYYPKDYYSFRIIDSSKKPSLTQKVLFRAGKLGMRCKIKNSNFITNLIGNKLYPYHKWIIKDLIKYDSSILDVGCGDGNLLLKLQKFGFKNLSGADPFIKETIIHNPSLIIQKKYIYELTEQYDFIMFHHSFEHMDNPMKIFNEIYRLLKHNASVLIRIPLASSYAWKKYGKYWVQLDAPRHFYLHTINSISILAKKANLKLYKTEFDSAYTQFTGSEKYLLNLAPTDDKQVFNKKEIARYKKLARQLNKTGEGDSACFYLKKE
ncbi:MAG: class I SAM-dependent methyltransferase [Prevotella sp.]|jgi:SAM-dependent methyltransferase|nr:class I SAM-dependent methyltransferase [Prevotella sp.]